MKALSIKQPWAYMITNYGKDIENRTWRTKFTGEIYIHAGKKIDKRAYHSLLEQGYKLPKLDKIKTGGLVGKVEIVGCTDKSKSKWFGGPYGFMLKNARPMRFRPCKGRLSFFDPNKS